MSLKVTIDIIDGKDLSGPLEDVIALLMRTKEENKEHQIFLKPYLMSGLVRIHAYREETEEEYRERMARENDKEAKERLERYTMYLTLKKEFEQ